MSRRKVPSISEYAGQQAAMAPPLSARVCGQLRSLLAPLDLTAGRPDPPCRPGNPAIAAISPRETTSDRSDAPASAA